MFWGRFPEATVGESGKCPIQSGVWIQRRRGAGGWRLGRHFSQDPVTSAWPKPEGFPLNSPGSIRPGEGEVFPIPDSEGVSLTSRAARARRDGSRKPRSGLGLPAFRFPQVESTCGYSMETSSRSNARTSRLGRAGALLLARRGVGCPVTERGRGHRAPQLIAHLPLPACHAPRRTETSSRLLSVHPSNQPCQQNRC